MGKGRTERPYANKNVRLWIIGNGFDLYHGLKTSYLDYKAFLCRKNTCKRLDAVYQQAPEKLPLEVCRCCCCKSDKCLGQDCQVRKFFNLPRRKKWTREELWRDLEEACELDFGQLMSAAKVGMWDDQEDSGEPHSSRLIRSVLTFADAFTGVYFCEWIGEVASKLHEYKVKFFEQNPKRILDVGRDDLFITFNYTRTPQEFYGVLNEDVCYVHGNWEEAQEEVKKADPIHRGAIAHRCLAFGSPFTSAEAFKAAVESVESVGASEKDYLMNHCAILTDQLGKDLESGFDKLDKFLGSEKFLGIEEVVVAGHSLGRIDAPYFDHLIEKVGCKKWHFVYYRKEDIGAAFDLWNERHLDACCVSWEYMTKAHFKGVGCPGVIIGRQND